MNIDYSSNIFEIKVEWEGREEMGLT